MVWSQENDSTECETPQSENASDDTDILPSNPLTFADAAYYDDADDDEPPYRAMLWYIFRNRLFGFFQVPAWY